MNNMEYITPTISFMKLPNDTDMVRVAFVFRYGFMNETNANFGLGHFFEHYLCAHVTREMKDVEVYGSISDDDIASNGNQRESM